MSLNFLTAGKTARRDNMKRNIFTIMALAVFFLVFNGFILLGCSNPSSNNEQKIDKQKTSIRIKNESYTTLMNVHIGDIYFEPTTQNPYGTEGLPGDPGYFSVGDISPKMELTEAVSGYIYFVIHIYTNEGAGAYSCYTRDLIVVNIGEEVEFVFTGNTLVIDHADPSNVQTLQNMVAFLTERLK
jgi:heme/copper-type cytochrome/quinol oxidase subunit 2